MEYNDGIFPKRQPGESISLRARSHLQELGVFSESFEEYDTLSIVLLCHQKGFSMTTP